MKLNHLFESAFDEKAAWDYIYRDCLLENSYSSFKEFLRSKDGKAAKYKAHAFLESVSAQEKTDFKNFNDFLTAIKFEGNVLNTTSSLSFYHYDELGGPPPFMIGDVQREFRIDRNAKTLADIPDWFPRKCRSLVLNYTGVNTFHNIHKVVKECKIITVNMTPVKSSIVGLMLIEGLEKVELGVTDEMVNAHPIDGAYNDLEKIINNNLKKNPKDVFEFQEELIVGGWKEYAKL